MKKLVGLSLVVIILIMAGCAPVRPVLSERVDTVTIWEIERDTTIVMQADSSMFEAWFECDSMNKVILTKMAGQQGKRIEQVVKWRDNNITVTAVIDSQAVYLDWKERHVKEQTTDTYLVPDQKKDHPLWWNALIIICVTTVVTTISTVIIKYRKK